MDSASRRTQAYTVGICIAAFSSTCSPALERPNTKVCPESRTLSVTCGRPSFGCSVLGESLGFSNPIHSQNPIIFIPLSVFSYLPYISQQCYNIDIFFTQEDKICCQSIAYEIFEKSITRFLLKAIQAQSLRKHWLLSWIQKDTASSARQTNVFLFHRLMKS